MKKLIYLLSIFLPFIAFADVLPEPFEENNNETSIIEERTDIDEEGIYEDSIEQPTSTENTSNNGDILDDVDTNNFVENTDEADNVVTHAGLADVYFGFCNDGTDNLTETLNAAVIQGEPGNVCVAFYNKNTNYDAYLYADVVFGEKAGDGSDACGTTSMSNFISSGDLGEIVIPADNYLIKDFKVVYPIGYDGEQKACFVFYSVDKLSDDSGGGLKFISRRVYYMNFFVGALDGIKNELTISGLTTTLDDNKDLILSFYVENIGNMENTFDIQGAVKGLFGYNKKFEITDGQVAPNGFQYVEANLGSLPSYGGKFDINFTINGTPYFSYDITNANVDPTWLEPKSWDFSTSVFKMPWLILAVVVIFIILLIVLFKKPKQKVVYVQQQPQQPVQPQQVSQQPTQQYTQPVQQPVQQPAQPVQQPQQPQNPNYPQN